MQKKIDVLVPEVRNRFAQWIADRGGVARWENINLSDPGAGDRFTPALTEEGESYPSPHWSVRLAEVVTDISRFRFVKEVREVKRFYVAVRRGTNGLMLKLTDGAGRRLQKALARAKESHNVDDAFYHFDYMTQECVISIPIWEESK